MSDTIDFESLDGEVSDVPDEEQELLDKFFESHRVISTPDYPKFTPYVNEQGETVSPLVDFLYYNKLPEVYRQFDDKLFNPERPLYKYLQSIYEAGEGTLANCNEKGFRGIENLLDLINPETCPPEYLKYYCQSLGIEWFQDLVSDYTDRDPYYYIRTFLCNIGEIYKRRGTESVVKYIAKTLTEMDVKLHYSRVLFPDGKTQARILWVDVQAETPEQVAQVELNAKVIKKFLDTQIPYYITSVVNYVFDTDIFTGKYHALPSTKVIRKALFVVPEKRAGI